MTGRPRLTELVGPAGAPVTTTTDGAKERLDVSAVITSGSGVTVGTVDQGDPNAGGAKAWFVQEEDGRNATLGAKADTAATTDTGTFSLIALFKRLLDKFTGNAVIATGVVATASGNTLVRDPASGKKVRLWWYHMAADPDNAAKVVAGFRFGAAGTLFGTTPLSKYGGAITHSFKAGHSYVEGAADEELYINLSAAQTVYGNVDIEEI